MSHFTVAVRLPGSLSLDEVSSEVDAMLRPYYEQGDAKDDFMEFEDKTDEIKAEFETGEVEQVRVYDKLYFSWDRELIPFVNAYRTINGETPLEVWSQPSEKDVLAAGAKLVTITYKEKYGTFESFAKEYYGLTANKEGQYGHWSNPNAKWDWFQIGGRWAGHWPAKTGAETSSGKRSWVNEGEEIPSNQVDIIRIEDIDFAKNGAETDKRVQKFLADYDKFFNTGETPEGDDPFYGVRHTALSLGLVNCLNEDEITEEQRATCKLDPWPRNRWFKNDAGKAIPRYDVIAPLPSDVKFIEFVRNQFNELRTYAYLDENGWVEPGKMGWFGMSAATAETREEYSKGFIEWLKSGDQNDWVVCVDCHI